MLPREMMRFSNQASCVAHLMSELSSMSRDPSHLPGAPQERGRQDGWVWCSPPIGWLLHCGVAADQPQAALPPAQTRRAGLA